MSAEKIKIIYEKNRGSKSDLFTPFLVILFTVSLFSHLYTTVQKKLRHKNIDEETCNPRYLFFYGFLNPLNKDPITSTQTNFQKCVAKNLYKPQALIKENTKNRFYIQKNNVEIENSIADGKTLVEDIKHKWRNALESKQLDINHVSEAKDKLFENQGDLYQNVAKKSTQLFKVLQSIVIYIAGILQLKVSEHKVTLDIEHVHIDFMSKYTQNMIKYNAAYNSLNSKNWTSAINTGREAIKSYEDMTEELEKFMKENAYLVASITKNCYLLKYQMDNDSCGTVFPHLNKELVAHYPLIKDIL